MDAIKRYVKPSSSTENSKSTTSRSKSSPEASVAEETTELRHLPRPPVPTDAYPDALFPSSKTSSTSLYRARTRGSRTNVARHEELHACKAEVMVTYLNQQQLERMWASKSPGEGVVLKKRRNDYAAAPQDLLWDNTGFLDAIKIMNVKCAMTVKTPVIQILLNCNSADFLPLPEGLRLQVLPTLQHLPRCQKHHFAAFVQDAHMLVVWDDQATNLLDRTSRIIASLMNMIWNLDDATELGENDVDEKGKGRADVETREVGDEEAVVSNELEARPIMLYNSCLVAATLFLLFSALGFGWRQVAQEIAVDGFWLRLILILVLPLQIPVSLFFFQAVVGNVAQICGPISQVSKNSRYYSAIQPVRIDCHDKDLPHVTIQMPVYREGLRAVIEPTILSLKAAISTYEMQGGTANIFVNDDGMQMMSDADALARREFYEEHCIGWVSRPAHNPRGTDDEPAFTRAGKFKKASNMNYALMISGRVEDALAQLHRHAHWTQEDEARAYAHALSEVVAAEDGRAWADGNIRIGDFILLIDSDTRVPTDCLLPAVSEMTHCPNVAILQFSSGVMNITTSFFENGITFFTNLIYTAVRYAVANGDVSPFVGHNALLRWSALQEVSFSDTSDPSSPYEKFWSESHVSEDFDMALRLQISGYIVRFAAYMGDGFKEGVSLTVYDELSRWEKYAYGCNELIFHPLHKWPRHGPITPLFRKFMRSNMPLPSKITICSYIGTYYAIACAWWLTFVNYFLVGWYNALLDKYYLDSFRIYFSLIIVFGALGNLSLAVFRYRLEQMGLFEALLQNLKWILLLSTFLGGISLHISRAITCHFLSIPISWGATSKEASTSTFFTEMPILFRKFKGTFALAVFGTALLLVGAYAVPVFWRINTFQACFPVGMVVVGHALLPLVLNPALMTFKF